MRKIIKVLLQEMKDAADNIIASATDRGFKGDIGDAAEVHRFLGNTGFDCDDYGRLYADSAILSSHLNLVKMFGTKAEKERAHELALYDYVD